MNEKQLREFVVRPTLEYFNYWSMSAENLLVGTSYIETSLGNRIKNGETGGLGIYGMTYKEACKIWNGFISNYKDLGNAIRQYSDITPGQTHKKEWLILNNGYSTIMARLKYLMSSQALPKHDNYMALKDYYYDYYRESIEDDSLHADLFKRVCEYQFN